MSSPMEELPLFPLNAVLFPYAEIRLHVFEERYREMLRHCVQFDTGFGVCLIREGDETGENADPYMVGTYARIVSVQTYDDGRMDVQVKGERRFRIRKIDESLPYMVAQVEPVVEAEIEDTPRSDAIVLKAREYLEELITSHLSQFDFRIAKIQLPQDPTALSFNVANLLHLANIQKQHLLETTDTIERIGDMLPVLEQAVLSAQEERILEAELPRTVKLSPSDFSDSMVNN